MYRSLAAEDGGCWSWWMRGRAYIEMRKHCFPDSFNVTCARDEVIIMTAARYGRMSKGPCLTSDYQVGCWADVLHHVDRKCSGRRHCVITIPDTVLHNLHPCQKDLFAYLESEHVCQKGRPSTPVSNAKTSFWCIDTQQNDLLTPPRKLCFHLCQFVCLFFFCLLTGLLKN